MSDPESAIRKETIQVLQTKLEQEWENWVSVGVKTIKSGKESRWITANSKKGKTLKRFNERKEHFN